MRVFRSSMIVGLTTLVLSYAGVVSAQSSNSQSLVNNSAYDPGVGFASIPTAATR